MSPNHFLTGILNNRVTNGEILGNILVTPFNLETLALLIGMTYTITVGTIAKFRAGTGL